jgi:hypothetical protein
MTTCVKSLGKSVRKAMKGPERGPGQRRKTMKITFLAAAAALVLGVGSAYAGDGDGPVPDTQFTEIPNVIAQAPAQDNHAYAANQDGSAGASQRRPTVVVPLSHWGAHG